MPIADCLSTRPDCEWGPGLSSFSYFLNWLLTLMLDKNWSFQTEWVPLSAPGHSPDGGEKKEKLSLWISWGQCGLVNDWLSDYSSKMDDFNLGKPCGCSAKREVIDVRVPGRSTHLYGWHPQVIISLVLLSENNKKKGTQKKQSKMEGLTLIVLYFEKTVISLGLYWSSKDWKSNSARGPIIEKGLETSSNPSDKTFLARMIKYILSFLMLTALQLYLFYLLNQSIFHQDRHFAIQHNTDLKEAISSLFVWLWLLWQE